MGDKGKGPWTQWAQDAGQDTVLGALRAIGRPCRGLTEATDAGAVQELCGGRYTDGVIAAISRTTGEVHALTGDGLDMRMPFKVYDTDWVPAIPAMVLHRGAGIASAMRALLDTVTALEAGFCKDPLPLVAVEDMTSIGERVFAAWSLKESKWVFVHGYKAHLGSFSVSDDLETLRPQGGYTVHAFPPEVRDAIGLNLCPEQWGYIAPGEAWSPRPPYVPIDMPEGRCRDVYMEAVRLADWGRANGNHLSLLFSTLEGRLRRFGSIAAALPADGMEAYLGPLMASIRSIRAVMDACGAAAAAADDADDADDAVDGTDAAGSPAGSTEDITEDGTEGGTEN